MGRKKYNEGSSINLQKNFKTINSLNASISGSVSGSKDNLYSRANINISPRDNRFSVGAGRSFHSQRKPQTSFSASYTPNKNTEITFTKRGDSQSLTYTRKF